MSTPLMTAIFKRLTNLEGLSGDALTAYNAMAAILGTDPDTGRPAVHQGNYSDVVAFPAITFRPGGGSPINELAIETGAAERSLIDLEIWGRERKATIISDIYGYLEQLLDMRRGVITAWTLTAGRVWDSQALTGLTLIYDSQINAWAGLIRYQFTHDRY
jgi:hypothetical protein